MPRPFIPDRSQEHPDVRLASVWILTLREQCSGDRNEDRVFPVYYCKPVSSEHQCPETDVQIGDQQGNDQNADVGYIIACRRQQVVAVGCVQP